MPGRQRGHLAPSRPALSRLVGLDPDKFADTVWGREPLLATADSLPAGFDDLFGDAAVDELISRRGLRTPFLRVAQDGRTLPAAAFTAGGGTGASIADQVSEDKLLRLFAGGATIVLQALHRTWPPLAAFAQQLAAELGHPVQVNSYTTPPQNQGFADHYDVHDVFVLQVAGEKTWRIRPPVHPAPLRDQPWEDRRAQVQQAATREPLLETTLRPGDCLYLPRGYLHSATALGGVSTHLTVGVHVWTRHAVAAQLTRLALRRLADDEDTRAALPLGVDVTDPGALEPHLRQVRAALHDAVAALTPDQLADVLAAQSAATQRPAPLGPLAQLRDADGLSADARLVLRDHLAARLVQTAHGWSLTSRAGDLDLYAADVAPARALLRSGAADLADVGLDLGRRLLRAGVAVVAGDGDGVPGRSADPSA